MAVKAEVDAQKRQDTARHHSATHLLHAALRQVLGAHVAQKGSLVNADYLRFDFSHFAKVTDEELAAIEAIVNQKIRENIPVIIREMPRDAAMELGAMALFGEKYGETVRVVTIDPNYSVELCGGTHVGHTGELGLFKFLSEGAVAAGVRRVEAITAARAEAYVNEQLAQLKEVKAALKNPKEPAKAVEILVAEKSALEKQLAAIEQKQVQQAAAALPAKAETVNGVQFLGTIVEASSGDIVRQYALALKDLLTAPFAAVICANAAGKAQVVVLLSDDLVKDKGLNAQKIIKEQVAGLIKGGGGGQPTLATAGGQDGSQFATVIEKVKSIL